MMKKHKFAIAALVVVLAMIVSLAWAGFVEVSENTGIIQTVTLFDAQTIAAGQSATSAAFSFAQIKSIGALSIQNLIAGSGTAKVEILLSNDGATWTEPQDVTDVIASQTAGTVFAGISCPIAVSGKLKVTETGSSDSITVTTTLAGQ